MNAFWLAMNQIWLLWEQVFGGKWTEIVVPTVCPAGGQFIGCLVPTEHVVKLRELRQYAEMFREEPSTEVALVNKGLGGDAKRCLCIISRFEGRLTQAELEHAAESLRDQIRLTFGMPAYTTRVINASDAELRLYW